jgi:hypothetical protein
MKPLALTLAAALATGSVGAAAATNVTPPLFPWTLQYLADNGFSDGCVTVRVLAHAPAGGAAPTEIVVQRSSGRAEFDALVVSDLRREIDVIGRFPVASYPADAAGWRTLPLRLSIKPDRRHQQVLGCAAAAPAH